MIHIITGSQLKRTEQRLSMPI